MSFLRQLGALLRKDILIRKFKRHYIMAVLEFVLPVIIWGTLIYTWSLVGAAFSIDGGSGPEQKYEKIEAFEVDDMRNWYDVQKIYFTPDNPYANNITKNIFKEPEYITKAFSSETDLRNALAKEEDDRILALQFAPQEYNHSLSYTMRWPNSIRMFTDTVFPEGSRPRIAGDSPNPGFMYDERRRLWPLMYGIFIEHLRYFNMESVTMPSLQALPTPAWKRLAAENLYGSLATMISGFIFGSFIIFLSSYSKNVMEDKETRLRELLRMMGLTDTVYWTNAFLVGLLNALPLCLMATGALCINFKMLPVLKADALLIFIVMLSYAIGIILLALLISVLVKSAKLGSVLVLLAQTAGFVVTIVLDTPNSSNYLNISAFVKLATSMYSPCGIYWAFKLIVAWEKRQIGASWSNLFEYAIEGDNITLGSVVLMMISSWILWAIVILYLDAIVPWQYGMPKNPLFFVRGSYWFPNRVAADQLELVQLEDSTSSSEDDMVEKMNGNNVVIRLNRITHNFGPLRAVDDLSLELYGNQITVLLGHNGAGKTTAMNILTGLFPPSRGDIFINGYDVRKNTKKAREGVGLCPQHNVLFDDLTVEEHLHFFAMLKSSNAVDSEVRDLMSKLELTAKKSTLAKSLSGGMKRKLSLANAMVGDSSVLILDEPSSGLDPEARRVVWDLLQQERTRRTVLMTTHYMEEADALGDRIAFLAKGKLMCAGSPMFLKRKFETGYKLRLTKVDQGLDPAPILDTIKSLLPQNADNVHLVSNMSYEIIINIGFPGSVQMIALFRHLESNQRQLGIESLGTSVTTMEDVFLKVGQREEDLASNNDKKLETSVNVFESFPKFQRLTGASLILRQMLAIFVMRFHSIRRDPKIIAYVTLLPLVFALLLSLIVTPGDGITRYKPITYDVKKLLSGPEAFLAGGGDDQVAKEFKNLLEKRGVSFSELPKLSTKEELDNYFLEQAKKDPARYKLRSYAGMLENSPSIYFNGQPYHIGAAAIADWQAATLKSLTRLDGQVTITNHPLDEKTREPPIKSKIEGMRFLSVLFMSLIFSCVSCAVIITPIQERVRKSKLIQVMSGVRPVVYIGSNFLFDGVLMLTAMLLCLILMLCFNPMSGFTNLGETIPSILLIFILFIFASTPWAYIMSYLFTSSTTGFSVYLAVNIVTVFIAGLIFSILEGFVNVVGNKADVYIHILNFIPVFSASWSFSTTYRNGCVKTAFDALGAKKLCDFSRSFLNPSILVFCRFGENGTWEYGEHSVFNMNLFVGIGFQLIASAVMGVIGSVLVVLIEMNSRRFAHVADSINLKKLFSCAKGSSQDQNTREVIEDSAVQEERQAVYDIVASNKIATKALVAKDVTKYYGSLRAVNNVSFHVEKNECFGLLGVNGAGKTTTFSMLTGDYMMSKGNSYIQNTDVTSKLQAYQEYIGYCPQFDALADTLTGREMLSLFCGLRGVPTDQVDVMIDFMTTMADLKPHINKLTQTYSGGNKRKLSLAIAMIGNPPLLFLDEPSAGVDPGARRKIWATLAQAQKELNSSVVLTSHSMDECEALCHRLVIMLRGTFRCLGSSQQIKSRYGEGFTVMIKTKAIEHDQKDAVYESMRHLFDGRCELKDSYQCLLQFHVNDSNLRWSEVFERIERLRENPQLQLEDVQVSDTTLEQVFLNFAKEDVAKPQGQQGTTNHAFAV